MLDVSVRPIMCMNTLLSLPNQKSFWTETFLTVRTFPLGNSLQVYSLLTCPRWSNMSARILRRCLRSEVEVRFMQIWFKLTCIVNIHMWGKLLWCNCYNDMRYVNQHTNAKLYLIFHSVLTMHTKHTCLVSNQSVLALPWWEAQSMCWNLNRCYF